MNTSNVSLLKIILSLFAVNSVSLYLYFYSHPQHLPFHHQSSENGLSLPENLPHPSTDHHHKKPDLPLVARAKPWPILPSYLPWSQNPNFPSRSCEGYFGNGFTRRIDLLLQPSPVLRRRSDLSDASAGDGRGGWFRCLFSETLRSSICEGGRLRMVPEKIRMSVGGESLEAVIGRQEGDELPEFESGAFSINGGGGGEGLRSGKKLVKEEFLDAFVTRDVVSRQTMRSLIDSILVLGEDQFQCSEWVEEPTLLVTRFEYANLFHTVTDWYSAYVASKVTGLPNRPHVIFVDGHCQAPLEETWKALFSSIRYAKNFSGPVCFRHAILSPLGYETALFKGLSENIECQGALSHDLWQHPDNQKTARLSEFGEMVRAAFGFPVHRHHVQKQVSGHNVLFVRREDYFAHPRHSGKVQSRLSNEQEVFDSLKTWVSNHLECKVNLVNGLFAHMTMKEQVRAIQDASVIIGAHGAGLTHIISATPKTVILEIISGEFRRPHFGLIARWKGLEYHSINLAGSYANPTVVVDKLSSILRSLGC